MALSLVRDVDRSADLPDVRLNCARVTSARRRSARMTYGQPPAWLILLVSIALALPSSAIVGFLGWWAWRRLFEREPSSRNA